MFLLDVDNTLLDNDGLKQHIVDGLRTLVGPQLNQRFWDLYEDVRRQKQYVDYPTTIERLAQEFPEDDLRQTLTAYIFGLPFRKFLFPDALDTVEHLKSFGDPAILSDGDPVFQPWKIKQSGLESAVEGRVVICTHKEQELPQVFARLPADHYVVIDDKPGILAALERDCPTQFTTILVLQGHYAARPDDFTPKPDYVVSHIGDVRRFGAEKLGALVP